MRAVICAIVLLCPAFGWADDVKSTTTGRQAGRPVRFEGGLGTYYEGLVVALLGNCSTESGATVATKERWEKALQEDHPPHPVREAPWVRGDRGTAAGGSGRDRGTHFSNAQSRCHLRTDRQHLPGVLEIRNQDLRVSPGQPQVPAGAVRPGRVWNGDFLNRLRPEKKLQAWFYIGPVIY